MQHGEYLEFHYSFYRTIILQLTLCCPLKCKHCSVFAAPRRLERMPIELILKILRDFAKPGQERLVVLTGGEPFALPHLLNQTLEEIQSLNLYNHVITSGHWATTLDSAKQVLLSMPAISLMTVSADSYHEEFVPLEYVRNAVLAAYELKRNVLLSIAIERGKTDYVDRIRQLVGQRVWDHIEHDVLPIMPTGRARNYNIGWFDTSAAPLPPGACELLGTPVVVHDGNVSCCCQIDATNEVSRVPYSPYRIGNLYNDTVDELEKRVDEDLIFQALRVWGPAALVQLLKEAGEHPSLKAEYHGICFLCRDLLANPHVVTRLRQILSQGDIVNQIRISRMIQYGELRPCPAGLLP